MIDIHMLFSFKEWVFWSGICYLDIDLFDDASASLKNSIIYFDNFLSFDADSIVDMKILANGNYKIISLTIVHMISFRKLLILRFDVFYCVFQQFFLAIMLVLV